jgi:predicted O-linked N-acetylglucosamine transferase (SPINDLY family)
MPAWESQLVSAQDHANAGRNTPFLEICEALLKEYAVDKALALKVGSLYLAYGFPSKARQCLADTLAIFTGDLNCLLSLAHAYLQLGQLEQCQAIFEDLLRRFPNERSVLRSLIYFSEYLPFWSNEARLAQASRWAKLTIDESGGASPRPAFKDRSDKKIRLGYVSADFCQHTVGILIKNVIAQHNADYFTVFCYSSGSIQDVVTDGIAQHSHLVNVAHLSDQQLADKIRSDEIDVLIDLSGHTGGSRLAAFALRPAPVQVSWLGYYATTGLEYIDAVLLDQWHIHQEIATQFIEPIVALPMGRWSYFPAIDPAPLIADPPVIKNSYITFGSFNNTLKYNPSVYKLWATILLKVPHSRLILKWRTFNDPEFRQSVLDQFRAYGVDPVRIELRGPSFHIEMLLQYKDIDIALDPFPFSGGVTSCEALYMGVPVITWPQDRVVSRQTYAFLSSIGHPELVAQNEESYVQKAVELANNVDRLITYRQPFRDEMLFSPLMQAKRFTHSLEAALLQIYDQTRSSGSEIRFNATE